MLPLDKNNVRVQRCTYCNHSHYGCSAYDDRGNKEPYPHESVVDLSIGFEKTDPERCPWLSGEQSIDGSGGAPQDSSSLSLSRGGHQRLPENRFCSDRLGNERTLRGRDLATHGEGSTGMVYRLHSAADSEKRTGLFTEEHDVGARVALS